MFTVILDDVRSTYNVGAIMRTLDGIGGGTMICCGITPYPDLGGADARSPVVITSNTKGIAKTALGAEAHISTSYAPDAISAIRSLKAGTHVVALEQAPNSIDYFNYKAPSGDIALVVGNEVDGLSKETIAACEAAIEIPQHGHKESLNVSVAAGIALYALSGRREESTDV